MRALCSIATSALVVVSSTAALTLAGPAAPAQAAPAYDCGAIYSIQGAGERNVRVVNTASGQLTDTGAFTIADTGSLNGLGLSADGSKAYGVLPGANNTRSIYRYDRTTETTTRLGDGETSTPVTHGAINPKNGNYYYGGFTDGAVQIYGFDTTTNQSMGRVASGTIPTGGANGDWAFDQQGNMYVIGGVAGNNVFSVINQELPTSGSITVTGTQIANITEAAEAINGIAFAGDGYLYLASGVRLFKVNSSTGAVVGTSTLSPANSGSVDLASCASPNTVTAQKSFPNGRVAPTDQATVTITGGGITQGNTGTTTGTDVGVQTQPTETAGPVFGLSGIDYTVTESGASTTGPGYVRTWQCIDRNASNAVLASGTGTTGTFTMPGGGAKGVSALCTFTNTAQIPAIDLDKQAGTATGNNVNDTITYTFVVTNTGNVPLATVTVADPKVGSVTCPSGELAPGASKTCTAAPYELTQADVEAGKVDNTATATGTPSTPGLPTVDDDDTTSTPIAQTPKLVLVKQAGVPVDVNTSGLTDAGDTVAYTFTITNDGNLPVSGLEVIDPLVGATTCVATTLAVGATTTCSADSPYTITTADETAGKVVNTAHAAGTRPGGGAVRSNDDSTTTVVQKPAPKISIDKQAGTPVDVNDSGLTDAGDTIAYTFTVTNTGNVRVSNLVVVDPLAGAVTCAATSLAPGASTACSAVEPYVVTSADEEAGSVDNVAHATGVDPNGGPTRSNDDDTTTPTDTPASGLKILKRAGTPVDVNDSGLTDAGDTIAYTFTVTNTGNVPLTDIVVNDPLAGAVTCVATSLAPGAATECAAVEAYVVTEADELAGSVRNVATVTGEDPDGDPTDPSDPSETRTPTDRPAPRLTLDKRAGTPVDVNDSGITDAGDTIRFTFTVTNAGNVPIRTVSVVDPMVGAITCAATSLAPGAATECEGDEPYTITEADEIAEIVRNTATVTGVDPHEGDVESDPDSTNTPVTKQASALTLVKRAGTPVDVNVSGLTDAGDTIAYTFTVTNDGNVPLFDVSVTDPIAGSVTCPPGRLAKGASIVCAADAPYVVTEADETGGKVVNVAHANAEGPDGDDVRSNEATTTTPTTKPNPSLLVDKIAGAPVDTNKNGVTDAGDTITYTFNVTNSGNVSLTKVAIKDPMLGDTVICAATTLAPGALTTCSSTYVLTQSDVDAGEVKNTATATGTDPDGDPTTSPEDSTNTPIVSAPKLELVKTATLDDKDGDRRADVGETIRWSFTVTNTGNVRIQQVRVVDPLAGAVTCEATALAPGASTKCLADTAHKVTQADVDRGSVDNVATAVGTPPKGTEVESPTAETTTPTDSRAALVIEKSSDLQDEDGDEAADPGEQIRYTFKVTNTGTVTITKLTIDDDMLADADAKITCRKTTLAPGASTTCAADYTVTGQDVKEKQIVNVATATGCAPATSPETSVCAPLTSAKDDTTTPADRDVKGTSEGGPKPGNPDSGDSSGVLPNTGGPMMALLWMSLLLLLGGAGMILRSRTRRA